MKEFKSFFFNFQKLSRDTRFTDGKSKNIITGYFTIVVLSKIKIFCIRTIEVGAGMFCREIKYFSLTLQFFIFKTISKVGVQIELFAKLFISSQVKSYPEAFPCI